MSSQIKKINDFVLHIATVNGSGSQSANNILVKTLFRMGIPVTGKNLFPSNIAGLPTWFTIRANKKGFTARQEECDIVIAMNPSTAVNDQKHVIEDGYFFLNDEILLPEDKKRTDIHFHSIPFKQIVEKISEAGKIKKLLMNMVYVGIMADLLELDPAILHTVLEDTFLHKATVIDMNQQALESGRSWSQSHLKSSSFVLKAQAVPEGNANKILIDGNSAAALGWLFGGCTFASWYPITPSSSLVESFQKYVNKYRKDKNGNLLAAVIQAEDELSAISMVLGAGWAGSRSVTATSGPGLSLMAEAAGLAYFAEIPSVIWDVQRVGPSTGLPTRTQQGDLLSAYRLSHGDTEHVVLLPATPEECFTFGQESFDLAEQLQTLIIVLSDLDLGMNLWMSDEFSYPTSSYKRGKVLDADDLNQLNDFARYRDKDKDGIPYRTLPGTPHPRAAFFTRGTGHDEKANYSEDPQIYSALLDRLKLKFTKAKKLLPPPIIKYKKEIQCGLLAYGSTDLAIPEIQEQLFQENNISTNYLRLRSLPLRDEVKNFISQHNEVYVIEQNRDGQLCQLLLETWPEFHHCLRSVVQYDGMPITPHVIRKKILDKKAKDFLSKEKVFDEFKK